jgi:hypothetical protein
MRACLLDHGQGVTALHDFAEGGMGPGTVSFRYLMDGTYLDGGFDGNTHGEPPKWERAQSQTASDALPGKEGR